MMPLMRPSDHDPRAPSACDLFELLMGMTSEEWDRLGEQALEETQGSAGDL